MIRLLPLLLIIGLAAWGLAALRRQPPARRRVLIRQALMWGALALLLLAVLTGRLSPLFAALGAALPLLLRVLGVINTIPGLRRWLLERGLGWMLGGGRSGAGRLRSRFLDLRIDPVSGRLDGQVQAGPFAGESLDALTLEQLMRMMEFYRDADPRSARLLEAYLARERGRDPGRHDEAHDEGAGQHTGSGTLDESEARAILGVTDDADAASIRAAHRRLMQRLHPDRGGSDYLAAQINRAKARLLGD